MNRLHAFEILAPNIHLRMIKRHGIHAVFLHDGVLGAESAVRVEFLFEQCVNGGVERKRKSGRSGGTEAIVDIKTSRTLFEEVNFGTAQAKAIPAIIPIGISMWFVVLRHGSIIAYPVVIPAHTTVIPHLMRDLPYCDEYR